jgi:hypothetical protein
MLHCSSYGSIQTMTHCYITLNAPCSVVLFHASHRLCTANTYEWLLVTRHLLSHPPHWEPTSPMHGRRSPPCCESGKILRRLESLDGLAKQKQAPVTSGLVLVSEVCLTEGSHTRKCTCPRHLHIKILHSKSERALLGRHASRKGHDYIGFVINSERSVLKHEVGHVAIALSILPASKSKH